MRCVTEVSVLEDYRLALTFDNGENGVVDLGIHVGKGVFSAWSDRACFEAVRIGEYGELVWEEDIELCPDALYLQATGKQPEDLFPALTREDVHA